MLELDTQKHQEDLASFVRRGEFDDVPPRMTPDRVFHYRRLVIKIVRDGLQRAYPLTHNLLPPKQWDKLVKQFFEEHACQSYQVWRMPGEFYDYVMAKELELKKKFPYLEELMEFEWTEMDLYCMEDTDIPKHKELDGNWEHASLLFNPYLSLKTFQYPVHRQNAKYINPDRKGRYFLLVYRTLADGKVHFLDVSAFHVFLVEQLFDGAQSLADVIPAASELFGLSDLEKLLNEGKNFLKSLYGKGCLLGVLSEAS